MLHSLQAARAVAAVLIVLHHTSASIFAAPKYFDSRPFGSIFEIGFISVDFFFVLSGFIIMYVHARDVGRPASLPSYLGKRFSRAYLPYWAVLLLILPVYFLVPSFGQGHERDPDVFLRAMALLPHPESRVVLVVSWTMVYELFFYLFFALLILNKRLGTAVMLAWLAGVLVHPLASYPWNFVFSPYHLRTFAGMAVALVFARWQAPAPRAIATFGIGATLLIGGWHVFHEPVAGWVLTYGCTLGSALGILGLVQADRSGLLRSPAPLVYLGNATYAIYLVHFPALSVLAKLAKWGRLDSFVPAPILFLLLALGAMGVGCLFHHLIEHPLHQLTNRLFRRGKAIPRESIPAGPASVAEPISQAA